MLVIFSQLAYGFEVFGTTTKANINRLQKIQNKIIKSIYTREWLTETKDLHKELKLLQVMDTYKLVLLNFVFKQKTIAHQIHLISLYQEAHP